MFFLRMVRSVGVVLTGDAPFCGEKKGIDHGEIVMIRGCRFELCVDGIGCSE